MHSHLYTESPAFDSEMDLAAIGDSDNDYDPIESDEVDDSWREEYETRKIQAFCDVCSEADFATPQVLIERYHWKLTSHEQFCAMHRGA